MTSPFHNNIKSTSSGTAGTGAFTPSTAAADALAWSTVPTGWIGLVRYDDGTSWELRYGYWNGTTISRPANGFVSSSSGSGLSLTSAATAALVPDGFRLAHIAPGPWRTVRPIPASTGVTADGFPAGTTTGTGAGSALAATDILREQPRLQITSATTANAQAGYSHTAICGISSSTAGRGGWRFICRFGSTGLPTGPRLFVGMTATTFVGVTSEPSALTANYAVFAKDSSDTNIQLLVNSNASTGTKTDTGIPLATGDLYEAMIWTLPGSLTVYALLIRYGTGDIFYTSTATDVPVTGSLLFPQCLSGLSATTGTAFILQFGGYSVYSGGT